MCWHRPNSWERTQINVSRQRDPARPFRVRTRSPALVREPGFFFRCAESRQRINYKSGGSGRFRYDHVFVAMIGRWAARGNHQNIGQRYTCDHHPDQIFLLWWRGGKLAGRSCWSGSIVGNAPSHRLSLQCFARESASGTFAARL